MVMASCPADGVVLDPFMGSGTTAVAARRCGRQFVGFELNPDYCAIIAARLQSAEAEQQVLRNQPTEPVQGQTGRQESQTSDVSKRLRKTAQSTTIAAASKLTSAKQLGKKQQWPASNKVLESSV